MKNLDRFLENLKKINFTCDNLNPNSCWDEVTYTCLTCKYTFKSIVRKLTKNRSSGPTGCAKCAKRLPYTDQEITDLVNKQGKVIKIGEFKGARIPFEVQCKVCNYKYKVSSDNLLNKNRNCKQCSKIESSNKQKYSNKELYDILTPMNIKLVGEYKTFGDPIDFQCLKCDKIWNSAPSTIIFSGYGCPSLSCNPKKVRYNEKLVGIFLDKLDIKYKNPYYIKGFKTKFQKYFLADFYLPEFNMIIEYNGEQHYKPATFKKDKSKAAEIFEKQQKRDNSLKYYCYRNKIKLLAIHGRTYKKESLWQFLKEYFYELTGKTIDQVARDKALVQYQKFDKNISASDNKINFHVGF